MSVRVKICGITTPEQALMVQGAGADLLGLVIYERVRGTLMFSGLCRFVK